MGIRRIIGLITVIHPDVVEVIVVLIDDCLDRVVFRIEGLYQDLALIATVGVGMTRRLGVCADKTIQDDGICQLDLFTDYGSLEKEKRLQGAVARVRRKYGMNAVFKGNNLLKGANQLERNRQIGGHKA